MGRYSGARQAPGADDNRYSTGYADSIAPSGRLLPLLDRVRQTGPDSWIACCPAHDDRRPSLSIRETGDGTLLVHCFGGCDALGIVHAVGLTLADLFPARLNNVGPLRRRWNPRDVLQCLALEARVASLLASDLDAEREISVEDRERLHLAAQRLEAAVIEVAS